MADSKITALTAISTVDPTADPLVIVDVSDTSMAASGTTKKSTINQLLGSGGTATLASATITGAATVGTTLGVTGVSTLASAVVTGDLTVDTSTLKVDSTNNVVGIQNATPEADALVNSALVIGNGTAARGIMLYGTTSSQQNIAFSDTAASQQGLLQYDHSVDQMKFFTSGALQATLTTTALTIANGNLVMATSGKGIDFSATTSGSGTMTSELLNDYEEGTWTPTVGASSGTPTTVTINSAIYTKIGRIVTVVFDFSIVAVGTATGSFQFSLPFNQSASSVSCGAFRENGSVGNMGQVFYNSAGDASCFLYNNVTVWNNGWRLRGTYTYSV